MKRVIVAIFLSLLTATFALACEIKLKVTDNSRSSYKVGEELIISLQVKQSHRVCKLDIQEKLS